MWKSPLKPLACQRCSLACVLVLASCAPPLLAPSAEGAEPPSVRQKIEAFIQASSWTTNQQDLEIYDSQNQTNNRLQLRNDVFRYVLCQEQGDTHRIRAFLQVLQLPASNRF